MADVPGLDPPTLGEVLRRLDDLRGDVASLIAEMKADREMNSRVYLRADLYTAERNAQNAIVADLHGDLGKAKGDLRAEIGVVRSDYDAKFVAIDADRKADLAWRRQVLLGMGILAVTTLLSIVGFVLTYTSR